MREALEHVYLFLKCLIFKRLREGLFIGYVMSILVLKSELRRYRDEPLAEIRVHTQPLFVNKKEKH